jgi:hypothetical protein
MKQQEDYSGQWLPQGTYFEPLHISEFSLFENAGSLKGLLRAFNGKGMEEWASESRGLNEALGEHLLPKLLGRLRAPELQRLGVELVPHTTKAGTIYLRWRKRDFSVMNDMLFEQAMASARTPGPLVLDLYLMEMQRIAFNMQMRITNQIATLALNAATKMAKAENLYLRRLRSALPVMTAMLAHSPAPDSRHAGTAIPR